MKSAQRSPPSDSQDGRKICIRSDHRTKQIGSYEVKPPDLVNSVSHISRMNFNLLNLKLIRNI